MPLVHMHRIRCTGEKLDEVAARYKKVLVLSLYGGKCW